MSGCPSVQLAILNVVNHDGVILRCGLAEGHDGAHVVHVEWTGPGIGCQDPEPHGWHMIRASDSVSWQCNGPGPVVPKSRVMGGE